MALIAGYDYPGNVRELENAIEHAVTVADGNVIGPEDLPAVFGAARQLAPHREGARPTGERVTGEPGGYGIAPGAPATSAAEAAPTIAPGAGAEPAAADRGEWSLADVEKEHIQRVLRRHHGNATSAARQLGISRTTLWRKLRAYKIARRGA
jgi:DNA-binding NtrC family response regulator